MGKPSRRLASPMLNLRTHRRSISNPFLIMKLSKPKADIFIPDSASIEKALARTTHVAIGAHQDDLEFFAYHGIIECYGRNDRWFTGITCTDGAGSSRTGI